MNNKFFGLISTEEAYSKAIVMQRLGISQKFWDKMLDEGLPYACVGHTRWVTGRDLIAHFEKRSQTKEGQAQ